MEIFGEKIESPHLEANEYYNCEFIDCDFNNADLSDIIFEDCEFHYCKIIICKVTNTKMRTVNFKECKVQGINFKNCSQFGLEISFDSCLIENCVFSDISLKRGKLDNNKIYYSDFINCDLRESSFLNSDLKGSIFNNSNLSKSDFRNAKNYAINPTNNNVRKAKFSLPEVISLLASFDIDIN